MSGGSFNYVCYKDGTDILDYMSSVKEMYEWLYSRGKNDAAKEVEKLYLDLLMFKDMMETRLKRLNSVLHDAEWWCSGDIGEKTFDENWDKFLEDK